MKKLLVLTILLVMGFIINNYVNGQSCGGGEGMLYSGTYCETQDDGSAGSDRNLWFDGSGNGGNQRRSQVLRHNFGTYASWNDGCEGGDAPTPRGYHYEVVVTAEYYDWTQVDACCEAAYEGLFFNFYNIDTCSICTVISDGARTNSCAGSGGKYAYGCGGCGSSIGGLPKSTSGDCMNTFDGSNPVQIGVDMVPSFVINDGNIGSCPDCDRAISDGAVSYDYTITVSYIYCEDDYTTPCTPTNDASCVVVSIDNIGINSTFIEDENKVRVNWIVENAENIKDYTLYKSIDGINFEEIITIKASDFTNTTRDLYGTADKDVISGNIYYYKVLITDNDGKTEWSNLTSIKVPSKDVIITQNGNIFKLIGGYNEVKIYSVDSRLVNIYNNGDINLNHLNKDTYIMVVVTNDDVYIRKIKIN